MEGGIMEVKLFEGTSGLKIEDEMNEFISKNVKKVIAISQSSVIYPNTTVAAGLKSQYVITITVTLIFEPKIKK
jgi:hypothetical protein